MKTVQELADIGADAAADTIGLTSGLVRVQKSHIDYKNAECLAAREAFAKAVKEASTAPLYDRINQLNAKVSSLNVLLAEHTLNSETPKPTPTTFEAQDKTWFSFTPGNPMPCDGNEKVEILCHSKTTHTGFATKWDWSSGIPKYTQIIGWRYVNQPWTLPTPPEGLTYHRLDWTEGMLPPGYRPHYTGEADRVGDEVWKGHAWFKVKVDGCAPSLKSNNHRRTTRVEPAFPATKEEPPSPRIPAPLTAADVPPGSVLRSASWNYGGHVTPSVFLGCVCWANTSGNVYLSYDQLMDGGWEINRSLSRGAWDASAWEPCCKQEAPPTPKHLR